MKLKKVRNSEEMSLFVDYVNVKKEIIKNRTNFIFYTCLIPLLSFISVFTSHYETLLLHMAVGIAVFSSCDYFNKLWWGKQELKKLGRKMTELMNKWNQHH